MNVSIRPYHPSDLSALYRICLKTGNSGTDASQIYTDPDILGHFYAAPYAVLEPDLCFVILLDGKPSGYILGTADSREFRDRCKREWFPPLRFRYPLPDENDDTPDAKIIRRIHEGHQYKEELGAYPAHLHIDLLPETQGMGLGRKLINTFNDVLRNKDVSGVHLEVGKKNEGAMKFYEKVGFQRIIEYEYSIAFGMKLK